MHVLSCIYVRRYLDWVLGASIGLWFQLSINSGHIVLVCVFATDFSVNFVSISVMDNLATFSYVFITRYIIHVVWALGFWDLLPEKIGRKYLLDNSRKECYFIIIHIHVCGIFIAYLYACFYFLFDIVGMFLTLVAFILFCTLTVGLEHLIYHFVVPFAKRQPSGSFWRGRLLMFFSQVGMTIPEIWHVVRAMFHCEGTNTQLP